MNSAQKHKLKNKDFIICKECGSKFKELDSHLRNKHKITCAEYKKKYNVKNTKCESILNKMRGKNNPGYQHGGRLSPWSKKSKFYSKTSKEKAAANRSYLTRRDYWINKGYNEEEAKNIISNRQATFTLEKCIEKYGANAGYLRWKERQNKWQSTLNAKSDDEKAEINRKKATKINYKTLWQHELTHPGVLYVIVWEDTKNIKIGITSRTLTERFRRDKRKYNILFTFKDTISKCFEIEQYILRKYNDKRLNSETSTECFKYSNLEEIIQTIKSIKRLDYKIIRKMVRNDFKPEH